MPSLLATVDLEEYVIPAEAGVDAGDDVVFETSRAGNRRLLSVLDRLEVRATFFTTLAFARRFPEDVAALIRNGHELGLHCYDHSDDYEAMDPGLAKLRIGQARDELIERFGVPIAGFRAARLRAPAHRVLAELGFRYDSSLHPTWVPGRYNHFRAPRAPFMVDGIVEVPISTTPLLRCPVSWFWLRNLGLGYAKLCARRASRGTGYVNFYVHPWEFADLPRLPLPGLMAKLTVRRTGTRFASLVERFLFHLLRIGMTPRTISEHLAAGPSVS